jgi:hypothetical protein
LRENYRPPLGGSSCHGFTEFLYAILKRDCYSRDQSQQNFAAGGLVVVTFELVGLGLVALFFCTLMSKRQTVSRSRRAH